MLFPSCQTVRLKWLDELAFTLSFLLLTTVAKRELLEKWTSSPVSFQGWLSFFSFVVFVGLLIHPRIRNEVKILNRAGLILTLPISISYVISVTAGTAALSALPVSIFIALTNVSQAVLAFVAKRSKALRSPYTLGSLTVILSAAAVLYIEYTESNRIYYVCLIVHIMMNVLQSFFMKKINMQISELTIVFYNNIISFVALFPVSVYNATKTHPSFGIISPCFYAGFFSLALQIFTFRVRNKNKKFFIVVGIAQLLTILGSLYAFEETLDFWVWSLIGINWSTTTIILHSYEENSNKDNQFILVVPNVTKNLYVEKYINYGDMA